MSDFEKDFYKLLNNAFYGKTCEIVRNRIKVEFIRKCYSDKKIKRSSKLTLNGLHKSYTVYDSYTFKQNEVLMDKPIYLGFTIIELSKLLMSETYYDDLQPYFGEKNLQLLYAVTDSFVLSVHTKDIINDLKNRGDLFDFCNLNKNHDLFSIKNKKDIGEHKIETPKNFCIDEFICLSSKMYAFKCGVDSQNKLKGSSKSQSKNIKFEEYCNCLFGEKSQQECDNYINRSLNHEKYLQRVKKSTLSQFDEKRCYENYKKKCKPWGLIYFRNFT